MVTIGTLLSSYIFAVLVYSGDPHSFMGTGVVLKSRPERQGDRVLLWAILREELT